MRQPGVQTQIKDHRLDPLGGTELSGKHLFAQSKLLWPDLTICLLLFVHLGPACTSILLLQSQTVKDCLTFQMPYND